MKNFPNKNFHQYSNLIVAVVGCDGAGKSNLTADLCMNLRGDWPIQLFYLGQDSGNILRFIVRMPLIGPAIGRYLLRKSTRAHAEDDKPASPDIPTALAIYLLSRWRRHKFQRMLASDHSGVMAITDRYPQAEVQGFHFDGPGLSAAAPAGGLVRWLAGRELRLYRDMANHAPALVIRLNIDAETAHSRKPDHKLSMLREKVKVIPTLDFHGAPIVDLDARRPYAEVLEAALNAIRTIVPAKPSAAAPGCHRSDLALEGDGLRT